MGVDVRISSPFSEKNFQVRPAEIYLNEKINFLTRVQFYCMEKRMKLGVHCPVCASKGTLGATAPGPWLPGVGFPFPGCFLLLWGLL